MGAVTMDAPSGEDRPRQGWRARGAEPLFMAAIVLAHLVIAVLLVRAFAQSGLIERVSGPPMVGRNISSDDIAPTLTAPEPTEVAIATSVPEPRIDIDPPNPQGPAGPPDVRDPYAGATFNNAGHTGFLGDSVASTTPVPSFGPSSAAAQPVNRTGSAIRAAWITELRERLKPILDHLTSALRPVQIEVLAQPFGGFNDERLKQGSGNAAVDREILASIKRRQNLIGGNTVTQTKWVTLEDIVLD